MFRLSKRLVVPALAFSIAFAASSYANVSLMEVIGDNANGTSKHYLEIEVDHSNQPGLVYLIAGTAKIDVDVGLFRLKVLPEFLAPVGQTGEAGAPAIRVDVPPALPQGIYVQAVAVFSDGSVSATDAHELTSNSDQGGVSVTKL